MKLSNESLTILKNFATINNGIKFRTGQRQSTMAETKTILATANLTEEFPVDFCIHDLNQFLSVHNSLYKDAGELEFDGNNNVIFSKGRYSTTYRMADESQIVVAPEKGINVDVYDLSFTLVAEDLDWVLKTASVLSLPNIAVQSDGDKVEIFTFDGKDDSKSNNTIQIGDGNGTKFKVVFKTDYWKMIPGTYQVDVTLKGFSRFKNSNGAIEYVIAIEKDLSSLG